MTKSRALWLVPLVQTVHNVEEALGMHRVLLLLQDADESCHGAASTMR
ncbi:hypothetical protein [Myxococcus sp. RHSTA-1-4]|nr:hypothetical protein [Myxococcus sp. RHSTA-1-4]MBZ4422661.1 hypothetical protein [Myxococcus sp. RHSTA-1-4]